MSLQRRATIGVASVILLGGCAHTPSVAVGYYLAKTKVSFKVSRTVACDSNDFIVVVNSATPTVSHSADAAAWHAVPLDRLRGTFSDSDFKIDLYEDGRLKGVNATSTGQGEAIFKTVSSIVTPFIGFDGGPKSNPLACKFITTTGDKKPITLTYEGDIDVAAPSSTTQLIPADTTSGFYAEELTSAIGNVCVTVEGRESPKAPAAYDAADGDAVLTVRQPGMVKVAVTANPGADCTGKSIWRGLLPVAQFGVVYRLPIPAAAIFGKQVFAATFAESGALTSLQYATSTGAGQMLNVINSAFTAAQRETTAQKAADVKAEADLIAQQVRLAQCLADPKNCSK